MRTHKILWLAVLAPACTESTTGPGDEVVIDGRKGVYDYILGYDESTGEALRGGSHKVATFDDNGKREAIDNANFPQRLHPDLTSSSQYRVFDAALTEGETTWPVFASTWWPQARNGTAWRWQPGANQDYNNLTDRDRVSPMEKYDLTFNPGQARVVEAVSHCSFPDAQDNPDTCTQIEHPQITVAGPATEWELENQGTYQEFEPDSWWGHCNGWASYATSEPLGFPRRDVRVRWENNRVIECTDGNTENCVLWRMADIEAMMTELYFSDEATFSGRRCNTSPDDIERDADGRPTDVACRDLNPGSFHTAIVGMFGRGARNLVTNETGGRPAFIIDHNWDHEIWNFPVVGYEITEQADVTEAQAQALVGENGSDYQWNSAATRFRRVQLVYTMISDSVGPSELLRRADTRDIAPVEVELNYVLELDANNRILGGEWIDEPTAIVGENSKELHPDFMWMALDHQGPGESADDTGGDSDNPFVSYSRARALLQCANDPTTCAPAGGGGGTGTLLDLTAEVARNATQSYDTGVVQPGTYRVVMSHDPARAGGDADLYVRVGSAPTTTTYDCRPYADGSDEECIVNVTTASTIFVQVRGYANNANAFRLVIEGEGGDVPPPAWEGMNESGTVARNVETRFATPELAAGTYRFAMTGTADADLYVRTGTAPTTTTFDCRPYASGSAETCSVNLTAPAVVHVMVRGYAASSSFTLVGSRE
jgi:hypothetical protein